MNDEMYGCYSAGLAHLFYCDGWDEAIDYWYDHYNSVQIIPGKQDGKWTVWGVQRTQNQLELVGYIRLEEKCQQ